MFHLETGFYASPGCPFALGNLHVIPLHHTSRECASASNTMLSSTINTGSYVIEKYSRSNPSHVYAPTQSQGLSNGQPEWEHFVHPNMSITLDVKKSTDNTYESVRLRIIWNNMNKGRDGTLGEAIMVRTTRRIYAHF